MLRIRYPNFFHPGSASKNLSILPEKLFLSSRKYDPGCSSRIGVLIFTHSVSRIQGSKSTGSRIQIHNTTYHIAHLLITKRARKQEYLKTCKNHLCSIPTVADSLLGLLNLRSSQEERSTQLPDSADTHNLLLGTYFYYIVQYHIPYCRWWGKKGEV